MMPSATSSSCTSLRSALVIGVVKSIDLDDPTGNSRVKLFIESEENRAIEVVEVGYELIKGEQIGRIVNSKVICGVHSESLVSSNYMEVNIFEVLHFLGGLLKGKTLKRFSH